MKGGFHIHVTIHDHHFEADTILFDKDGTLIDFYSVWGNWGEVILQEIDSRVKDRIPFNKNKAAHMIGLNLEAETWDPKGPLAIGGTGDLITLLTHYLYQHEIPWNDALTHIIESFEAVNKNFNWNKYIKPINGVIDFLSEAKSNGIKMAVVTSDLTEDAILHLKLLGIDEYFSTILGHDSVSRGKPFSDMADLACEQLNANRDKTIVFGDSNGDMKLAKNANLKAGIGVTPNSVENASYLQDAELIINNYNSCSINK
ncbi:HAD family hydrolase [Halalkalibacillus halophilus]|uniref:HAD family hydrolase n=1 Tax=Halalkalibacillus halophilus TaxID=392827 RepID=UPI00146AB242|nr:HAD-IA family hydrolase [Halalkalibacillus halophilus]